MGPIVAVVYAALMISGYASQVHQIYKSKSVKNLRFTFFLSLWLAVSLRMVSTGIIIFQTSNLTAWALEIAEFSVWGGLATIVFQLLWYKHLKPGRK